jgi:hypothetical protein
MNGLVKKTPFFIILSGIFALVTLIVLSIDGSAPPPGGVSHQAFGGVWATFTHMRGAAATGFVAIGAFLWLFSTFLWRVKWVYPWLVAHRDITGTWFAESAPGVWNPFTTLMHVEHGFFRISVELIRRESRGRSVIATFERSEAQEPRLFVVYNSFVRLGPKEKTPTDGRSAEHSGCLRLDLTGERTSEQDWKLEGEYWTNKQYADDEIDEKAARIIQHRGTWGRMEATWKSRVLLPMSDPDVSRFLDKYRLSDE